MEQARDKPAESGEKSGGESRSGKAALRAAARLRAASSLLVDRAQFASRAGLSFQNPDTGSFARSLNAICGYKEALEIQDFRDRYERNGVAERVIEIYPDATWAGGADIQETEDVEETTAFEGATRELFRRLSVWERLYRADVLAGLGRYGALLIGVGDGDLESEMPRLRSQADVVTLTPLPEDCCEVEKFDEEPTSPRYSQPLFYRVRLRPPSSSAAGKSGIAQMPSKDRRVHWTRVVHLAEGLLSDDVFGKPRLRAVWNYLDDLDKIVAGGSEATFRKVDPGLQIDVDPAIDLDTAAEEALDDELDEYLHGISRVLRTRGTKVTPLAGQVPAFGPNANAVLELVCATIGVPIRIFKGSERGELASSQDRSNFNDRVQERRRTTAEPWVRGLVDRLIERGALPEPATGYNIVWPPADELDEFGKLEVVSKLAAANAAQAGTGDEPILTANEIRDRYFNLDPHEAPDDDEGEETEKEPGEDEEEAAEEEPEGPEAAERAAAEALPQDPRNAALLEVASRHESRFQAAFRAAFEAVAGNLDMTALEKAFADGDQTRAAGELIRAVETFGAEVDRELVTRLAAAGAARGAV